jgi:prevent-host-death family protein
MKGRPRSGRAGLPVFRNQRGERVDAATFTSTVAKNEFGRILEIALRGRVVVITKHDTPKAVLVSLDEFNAMTSAPERTLEALTGEFDAMLARMQTPKARAGMKAAFDASPKELGKAAVAAARKRG